MGNKKEIRLFNVLFPLWLLLLFPHVWLIVLPGNFVIDSLVLLCAMMVLKTGEKKQFYQKHILKIFISGVFSDIIGALYMLIMLSKFEVGNMGDEWYLTVPAIIISAVLIFVFNHFFTFKRIDRMLNVKLSLTFAIITAPYTFLVPSSLL